MATLKLGFVPVLKNTKRVVEIPKKPKVDYKAEAEKAFKNPKTEKPVKKKWTPRYPKEKFLEIINIYPTVFNKAHPLPLMIGIHHILLEAHPEMSKRFLKVFMNYWVYRKEYQGALTRATHRYDLQGNIVSEITQEQKDRAKEHLEKRKKR